MKALLALTLLMVGSVASADVLECKLVVNGNAVREYADRGEVATVEQNGITCSGKREGMNHKVKVTTQGNFTYSAEGPSETIVIIDGGSSDIEVYAKSFCSCSSM